MVTMPDFGFDGVSSSLAKFMSISFFQLFLSTFFLYYVRNPDTTDNRQRTSSAGCVLQPAGHNAIQSAAYQPSRKQHHTRAVVCLHCITVPSCQYDVLSLFEQALPVNAIGRDLPVAAAQLRPILPWLPALKTAWSMSSPLVVDIVSLGCGN